MLKLFDIVTLRNDDSETGIKAGAEGTIKYKKLHIGLDRRILTCYNNILYLGIAKLVSRLVWECRGYIRDRAR